jgi:4-amino-4-deoxy-L-arabinose transferase-like glycosyltransferase
MDGTAKELWQFQLNARVGLFVKYNKNAMKLPPSRSPLHNNGDPSRPKFSKQTTSWLIAGILVFLGAVAPVVYYWFKRSKKGYSAVQSNHSNQTVDNSPQSLPVRASVDFVQSQPVATRMIAVPEPLLWTVLAFLIAGFGQAALLGSLNYQDSPLLGWILFGLAAILFIFGFRKSAYVPPFAQGLLLTIPDFVHKPHFSRLQWILLANTILCGVFSLALFNDPSTQAYAWDLHIASLMLFIAVFIPFGKLHWPTLPSSTKLANQLLRLLPIIAILALAGWARLWQLGEFPFGSWWDEAANGIAAVRILKDPGFRPIYLDEMNLTMPLHFNYLIAGSFSLFGISPLSLRFVTAAFGVAGVLFAYLLFRRWFGEGLGLLAALLLAVMRYDLTFSRIGMSGIASPTFELASLFFLDRALEKKRTSDFAWLGLTVGLGLVFYTAFRVFPFVLMLFLLGFLVVAFMRFGVRQALKHYIFDLLPKWLIGALALMIVVAPVAQFAIQNSQVFFARTSGVSIFENRSEPDLGKAIWSSTLKHLEMFNLHGDNNGRHNLPGAPMLDPVMGVLFVLGLAFALAHWRNPANSLMLLLFLIGLLPGILSLDFEAPQSLRSIGVIPALVYFISLPLAVVAQAVVGIVRPNDPSAISLVGPKQGNQAVPIMAAGFLLLSSLVMTLNFSTFFDKQRNDPGVWASHSAPETLVADEMKRNASNFDFVLSALFDTNPTIQFIAGDITNIQFWKVTDRLPLVRPDTSRGVIMMFDDTLLSAYDDARRLYPTAQFIEHQPPSGGGPILYEVILTPHDLSVVQGVTARYFAGGTVTDNPVKTETLTNMSVDWTGMKPLGAPFIAEITSTLYATQYGEYRFLILGTDKASIWLDEYPVGSLPLVLARGNHALRLQIPAGDSRVELWWQPPGTSQTEPMPANILFRPPVTNSGLLGSYFPSPNWSGAPGFTQIDPQIAFYFHVIPFPRPYSIEWKGKLYAPITGQYAFALTSIDGSQLRLDQRLVVDNPNAEVMTGGSVSLTRGWHDVLIRFSDRTSGTRIYLYWKPPDASEPQLIPSHYLSPPMGQYPAAP